MRESAFVRRRRAIRDQEIFHKNGKRTFKLESVSAISQKEVTLGRFDSIFLLVVSFKSASVPTKDHNLQRTNKRTYRTNFFIQTTQKREKS